MASTPSQIYHLPKGKQTDFSAKVTIPSVNPSDSQKEVNDLKEKVKTLSETLAKLRNPSNLPSPPPLMSVPFPPPPNYPRDTPPNLNLDQDSNPGLLA